VANFYGGKTGKAPPFYISSVSVLVGGDAVPAPTFTNLTSSGTSTDATSFTTASVTPTASRLILVVVHAYMASASQPPQPTVTGNGITYALVLGQDVDVAGSDRATMWVFRGMSASPSAGAVTIDFGATTIGAIDWSVDQSDGNVDTSGTNGSGAVVSGQTGGVTVANATSATVTYPAAITAGNSGYAAFCHQVNQVKTPRTNWSELSDFGVSVTSLETQYIADTDTAASASWASSSRAGGIAIEVKAAAAGGGNADATLGVTAGRTAAVARLAGGTKELPGSIAGVEPESHAHNPPVIDGNGNLYRVVESDLASGNHPQMMRSTDGGSTWAEVDSANRPSAQDLEGLWTIQVGTQVIVVVTRDDTVWFVPFNTSDAASSPDTWGAQEAVDSGLSSSGVEQYSSVVRRSNGEFVAFYSDTLSGSNNQIAYKVRSTGGAWGTKQAVTAAFNATAPASVLGASDTTHLVYCDSTNDQLLWRTLTTGGTLSGSTRIDSAGTATDNIPHANPIYYDDAGSEVVAVAYADSTDILKLVRIVGGAAQTPETVSAAAITMDPGTVTNGGTVAHLAVDGTTIHAVWSDASTGDLKYRSRAADGTWSTETTLWASGPNAAYYVYNTILTYPSGAKVMAYTYDVGDHATDVSDLKYDEWPLATTTSASASLSVTGSLSGTATNAKDASASVAASAGLTATATGAKSADATVTTTGSVTAAASTSKGVDSSLGVTATLTATATTAGSSTADATLSVTASTSTAAMADKAVTASVASSAAVTASATVTASGTAAATLTETAAVTAAASTAKPVDAAVSAATGITASATVAKAVTASLPVTATVTATGGGAGDMAPSLTGTASLSSSAVVDHLATGAVSATASITAAATVVPASAAVIAAATAITAAAAVERFASANLLAAVAVAGAGERSITTAAVLTATATVTPDGTRATQQTPRPDEGRTTRPASGTTSRPYAGTTTRP